MATLFITHDLGLAADCCDRIVVMHAGHTVESAPTETLFSAPRHPYTARLMSSTPDQQGSLAALAPVPGNLPNLRRSDLPSCRFSERCTRATGVCSGPLPVLASAVDHAVACWHPLPASASADEAADA